MKLRSIAHSRCGDKGSIANISLIAYDARSYPRLARQVTADRVKRWFDHLVEGPVVRYELPTLGALNFVLHGVIGGGVTRTRTGPACQLRSRSVLTPSPYLTTNTVRL